MNLDKSVLQRYNVKIEELIPKILDSIVAVYGEKNRKIIEERLNKIYINTYITYEDIKTQYNMQSSHLDDMLSVKFLKKMGIEISKETEDEVYEYGTYKLEDEKKQILNRFFGWGSFLSYGTILNNFNDEDLKSDDEYYVSRIIEERCKLLREYGLEVTPENYEAVVTSTEGKHVMTEIKKVYEIACECKQEREQWEKENRPIKEYIEQCQNVERQLDVKYLRDFYEQIIDYVSEEEKRKIEEMLQSETEYLGDIRQAVDPEQIYYSKNSLLEAFSEKYNEIIYDDEWSSRELRNKRIKYFKLKGIDLGDEYSAYEESEETKKIWPDSNLVNKIAQIQSNCEKAKYKEMLIKTSNYEECKNNIAQLGLCLDDAFNVDFVRNGTICLCPNACKSADGSYKNFNVIHLPILNMLDKYKDTFVIHEILHAIETTMKQISDTKFYIKFGFDSCIEELVNEQNRTKEDDDDVKILRQHEIIAENLHQWISILVTKHLHERGIYLFDDPKNSKLYGSSSYEQINPITKTFRENFHNEIIDNAIGEDLNGIFNVIGEENFNKLSRTVMEYREMPYNQIMNDVINKRDTELTRKRNQLISRSEAITEDMKSYNKNHNVKYQITTAQIEKVTRNQSIRDNKKANMNLYRDSISIQEGEQTRNG